MTPVSSPVSNCLLTAAERRFDLDGRPSGRQVLKRVDQRQRRNAGCGLRHFANAGVAKYAPLGTITEEFYYSMFNINVKGLLFTVQMALPLLQDGASIILNASV